MRIVLDTASFVTALRSTDGAAGEILKKVLRREILPLMDMKLSLEYRAVALRPEHLAAARATREKIEALIVALEAFSEHVEILVKVRPLSTDPDDDMVLDLAINGQADALVTSNIKHFAAPAKRFGIPVLTPGELLGRIRRGEAYGN